MGAGNIKNITISLTILPNTTRFQESWILTHYKTLFESSIIWHLSFVMLSYFPRRAAPFFEHEISCHACLRQFYFTIRKKRPYIDVNEKNNSNSQPQICLIK